MSTLQVADKPTLDSVKSKLESHNCYIQGTRYETHPLAMPSEFCNGSSVVYHGEIHVFGGNDSTNYVKGWTHYKFNPKTNRWSKLLDLPYQFYQGCAVVYKDEIHIMGSGLAAANKYHYKWDEENDSWSSVSTLVASFCQGVAFVLNDTIYIEGGYISNAGQKTMYYFDDSSSTWTKYGTDAPGVNWNNTVAVLNDTAYIFYATSAYVFDGSAWTTLTVPYNCTGGRAVTASGYIYLFGSSTAANQKYAYKFDGTNFTKLDDLPYEFYLGGAEYIDGGSFYLLGSALAANKKKMYRGMSGISTIVWTDLSLSQESEYTSYYLEEGTKIYCDRQHTSVVYGSVSEIDEGYEVDTTGYVQISALDTLGECYTII